MPTVTITPPDAAQEQQASESHVPGSALPKLLQTPLGLALVELQGNINHPGVPDERDDNGIEASNGPGGSVTVGRLVFPDYKGEEAEGPWTKRVWLYVGEHQRMTGEVKKLKTPLGILRRKSKEQAGSEDDDAMQGVQRVNDDENTTELEIAEIIRWKVTFGARPEPVGVV